MNKIFFAQNVQQVVVQLGYGYLYNWWSTQLANFAPADWAVPTETQIAALTSGLGGDSVAGGKLKETGTEHWLSESPGVDNSSGFTGWGGGHRNQDGTFLSIKAIGMFWSQTAHSNPTSAYQLRLDATLDSARFQTATLKEYGNAIRLIYTGGGTPATVTDYDGNIYDTVVIGSQRWIVQNWKCTHENDGTALTKVTDAVAWSNLSTEGYCAYDNNESYV